VLHPGGGDSAATWQSGCGRTLLEQRLEHGFWTTWHGEPFSEDHDWSSSSIHADRAHTRFATPDGLSLGVAIRNRAGVNSDPSAHATAITRRTRSFTRCEQVAILLFVSGYNSRL
jgi:hypothetical protein